MVLARRIGSGLALEGPEWRTFAKLIAGEALFIAAASLPLPFHVDGLLDRLYFLVALFGLPLLLFGPRNRLLIRALVYLIGIPVAHYLAVQATATSLRLDHLPFGVTKSGWTNDPFLCGATGGLVGSAVSLLFCWVAGLARLTTIPRTAAAILFLAAIGGAGVSAMFAVQNSDQAWLALYVPWQAAFAYVLAKLLRS
jgi:hypothetical protein